MKPPASPGGPPRRRAPPRAQARAARCGGQRMTGRRAVVQVGKGRQRNISNGLSIRAPDRMHPRLLETATQVPPRRLAHPPARGTGGRRERAERGAAGVVGRRGGVRLEAGTLPPLPSLPYKVDTSRPSLRTNWTRLGVQVMLGNSAPSEELAPDGREQAGAVRPHRAPHCATCCRLKRAHRLPQEQAGIDLLAAKTAPGEAPFGCGPLPPARARAAG